MKVNVDIIDGKGVLCDKLKYYKNSYRDKQNERGAVKAYAPGFASEHVKQNRRKHYTDIYRNKDIKKKYLRDHVGIVLQEPFLFNKSVKDNISLARKKASEKEIFETAATAAVHSVIMKFDKKYDTEVGEGGVTLSGGQKQRIAIARILIKNPPVLVFDDSLSAVDTITDESIRRELKKRERKSTTFIISHRITTLSEADKIIVLEDGSISAVGSHKDLISRDGLYQRIWNIQSAVSVEAGK